MKITIRKAKKSDFLLIYQLSNEPSVRDASLNSNLIELDHHAKWFNKKIIDPNYLFLIAEINGKFAGQVRLEVKGKLALISISICKNLRSRGLGGKILDKSLNIFYKNFPKVKKVIALVKKSNLSSMIFFKKHGFYFSNLKTANHSIVVLVHQKDNL